MKSSLPCNLPYDVKLCQKVPILEKQKGCSPVGELRRSGEDCSSSRFLPADGSKLRKLTFTSVYIFPSKIVKLSLEACEADISAQYGEW